MINRRNFEQLEIPGLERWRIVYSPQKLKVLQKSWANIFRQLILPNLPIEPLVKQYSKKMGRKTKEIYTVFGASMLQQFFNLTDEETCNELAFNQLWHFALESFAEADQVISLKTLWSVRNNIVNLNLAAEIFPKITDAMIKYFDIDLTQQRLDSVHVHSNMAKLGRIRILSTCMYNFLKNIKRKFSKYYEDRVSSEIKERYTPNKKSYFSEQTKPSESSKTLQQLGEDLHCLITEFGAEAELVRMNTYKMMKQVFSEHCIIEENEVKVKSAKEVSSSSLQNPSDPDASYDGHKGQGYQSQIMETYSKAGSSEDEKNKATEENEDKEKNELNLITYINTEPAHKHDSQALEPAIKNIQDRGIEAKQVLADTLYGSNDNKDKMKEIYGVDLISPIPGKPSKNELNDFDINPETLNIKTCPGNKCPDEISDNPKSSKTAIWYNNTCINCKLTKSCKLNKGKKGRRKHYSLKSAKSIIRRRYEDSYEFKDEYRYRSGIEASISRFILMTSGRRMRYRGLKKMNFAQQMRALAINMFRVRKYLKKLCKNNNISLMIPFLMILFSIFSPQINSDGKIHVVG